MDLTPEEERELEHAEQEFEDLGGRSVALANRIDYLTKKANWDGELACPDCGSEELATVERIMGRAEVTRATKHGFDYEGWTEMDWDSSYTEGIECSDCGWCLMSEHQDELIAALRPAYETLGKEYA